MRDSLIFYRSFAEGIKCLPEEEQLKALWNIINYALDDEIPDGDGAAEAIFKMARPQIDKNSRRYENGTKGGRPKTKPEPNHNQTITKPEPNHNQTITKPEPNHNQTITKPKPNHNQTITKPEPNDNDNDNVNDNVNDNDNVNANGNENENDNGLGYSTFSDKKVCPADAERVIDAWNAVGVNPIKKLSPNTKRYEQLYARIREYGVDEILAAVAEIGQSEFLRGSSGKFLITFDWFIKPNNFIKVLEGNYRDRASPDVFDEWRDA